MALDISKIIQKPLDEGQYFTEQHPKNQIVIHHTAGSSNPYNVVSGWNANLDKIGTPLIIAGKPVRSGDNFKDGEIVQCFSTRKWAYHLGVPSETFKKYNIPYKRLDKTSIGIELCNWGYVTKLSNGTFKNYVGGIVPEEDVIDLGKEFRGHRYYHAYTDAQISSLKDILIYLCDKYNIPKTYNSEIWAMNQGALNGQPGIYSHTSYRSDKYDCFPQPSLIEMLKSLGDTAFAPNPLKPNKPIDIPTT